MRILIDADGCPVVNQAIRLGNRAGLEVILLCDTSHVFQREGARTITVSKGADSVDFALVNLLEPGDVAVTQERPGGHVPGPGSQSDQPGRAGVRR